MNPCEIARSLKQFWSPRIVAEVNDSFVKVAKIKGEFPWHSHEDEDEMFLIVEGQLLMELKGKSIELNPGEFLIIPKGVEHKPYAEKECHIMLIEPRGVLNTGEVKNELTAINDNWI